ncbi:hypothetical protein AAVH_11736 [Aphelenchoides avenae]|nr:hypothetical protein AAVH_11736 [Aphelenchus avenae]
MASTTKSSVVSLRQDLQKELAVVRMDVGNKDAVYAIVNEAVQNVLAGSNYAELGKRIKERMDTRFDPPWHCIIGSDFACETSCAGKGYAHFTVNGYLSVIVYRTADAQCE